MATFWRDATSPRGPSRVQRLKQSEKAWQAQVVALAQFRGWATYHCYDSRKSTAGMVDLILCRPPRLIMAELKTDTGMVSAPQRQWLDALAACPVEAFVWRPSMWTEIDAILA